MKPQGTEWIPFYGMFKYYSRYFRADKRDIEEAIRIAQWVQAYHIVATVIVIALLGKALLAIIGQ
jgi:hypothetical protein